MKNLYKAHLMRLINNKVYLGGCLIALIATCFTAAGQIPFPVISRFTPEMRMIFAGAAMFLYFALFPAIFINPDYTDGVIRNRIILGYGQDKIFYSFLLVQITAVVMMFLCYVIGGLIGGAMISGEILVYLFVLLSALIAYTALITAVSFRCRKLVSLIVFCMVIFNGCFNCVLFGNAIMMLLTGTAAKIGSIFYNINGLGQWFCMLGLGDDTIHPGAGIQVLLSLIVFIVSCVFGAAGIRKRDLV